MKIEVELKDAFSGCVDKKVLEYKAEQSEKFKKDYRSLKKQIGSFVDQFDKKEQIHYTWEILNVKLL